MNYFTMLAGKEIGQTYPVLGKNCPLQRLLAASCTTRRSGGAAAHDDHVGRQSPESSLASAHLHDSIPTKSEDIAEVYEFALDLAECSFSLRSGHPIHYF